MGKTYMTIAEIKGGKLRQVTLEALQAAKLIQAEGERIVSVVIGHQVAEFAKELASYGPVQVISADHRDLEHYNPETYFSAVSGIIDSIQPDAILMGHTAIGRDLAPMIAAKLGAGQISDVIAIERSGSDVSFTRPIYAGKAFEKKRFTEGVWVATIRPNNIPAAQAVEGVQADVLEAAYSAPPNLRTMVRSVVHKASGKVDLAEAKIVVSGGRGVKSADGFCVLEQLAEVLNAAVGASRGACDAGYCDYSMQIGQTGKVVTPEIYIACGISGAIQHLAGMSQSRIIIAINKDPEAPIFKIADYGIVGDLFEVVPLLTEEFRKALA